MIYIIHDLNRRLEMSADKAPWSHSGDAIIKCPVPSLSFAR